MWINFLSLLPQTLVTVLVITIAFLRFYDQTDFQILGIIAEPRIWSNRFTVAAIVATVANFGVEWYRRNRETNRLAEEKQRRDEERECTSRRARIETRCRLAQIRYQLEPSEIHRQELINIIAILEEYGQTL